MLINEGAQIFLETSIMVNQNNMDTFLSDIDELIIIYENKKAAQL
jgi:hypothetical protein